MPRARRVFAALLLAVGAASILASVPAQAQHAGGYREFGDWTVACDNALQCVAVSVSGAYATRMAGAEPGDLARPRLWVRRDAGPDAPVRVYLDTKVWGEAVDVGPLALVAPSCTGNCLELPFALTWLEPGLFQLEPAQVRRFMAASRHSNVARTQTADGAEHGLVSTAGLTAALRWMDAAQGRAGTVTAVFARGPAPAASVPPAPPRPVVQVATGVEEEDTALADQPQLLALHARHCPAEALADDSRLPVRRYLLSSSHHLWSFGCGAGPYRVTRLWVIEWPDGRFAAPPLPLPAGVAARQGVTRGHVPGPVLGDGHFDPVSGMLTGYTGMLCGWQRRWGWTGTDFALIDSVELNPCLDLAPPQWLQTYRAIPERAQE